MVGGKFEFSATEPKKGIPIIYTFDAERPVTPVDHILRDYREGPAWSRVQHFQEWTRLVNKTTNPQKAEEETAHLMNIDYSIHYHVWTQAEMLELFATAKRMFPFEIELIVRQPDGVIFILKKTP